MANDTINLLHEYLDYIIEDLREQGQIKDLPYIQGEKSNIPKDFKQGDFVKLFGQFRTSIDDNGKEHSNVRILSSKLLKAKEQMKGQEEKKESVLGAIKKYQAEDKQKPKESKEKRKETER